VVYSDNAFNNECVMAYLNSIGARLVAGTPDHPAGQARVKRRFRELRRAVRCERAAGNRGPVMTIISAEVGRLNRHAATSGVAPATHPMGIRVPVDPCMTPYLSAGLRECITAYDVDDSSAELGKVIRDLQERGKKRSDNMDMDCKPIEIGARVAWLRVPKGGSTRMHRLGLGPFTVMARHPHNCICIWAQA
jgi:hypothetical protein